MLCFETTVGRLQAITYFISVVVSFFVVVPVGINLRNFQGQCILFAQVVWDERTIFPYSEAACDFVLYMNLGATLLYAFWMGVYSLFVTIPRRFPFAGQHYRKLKQIEPDQDKRDEINDNITALEKQEESYRILSVNPVFMLINTVIFFLVLSNAVIITVGLQRFCQWTIDGVHDDEIDSCQNAQDKLPWYEFKIIRGNEESVQGDQFYVCMGIACIASWVLFLVWLFQWILNFSQSFTMCSCEVAEEKRKPDQAVLIAARRSRLATPIATPGHMTPGGRYTPPVSESAPMRPYNFGPPQLQQYARQPQQSYMTRPQHPQPQQQPRQQQPPMRLQQGYAPPRR